MTNYELLESATEEHRRRLFAAPIIIDCFAQRVELHSYVAFLTQAYHHVRHTVPLLMTCGSHLPARLGWLQRDLVKYIDEEQGHEQWILNDISACGADAEEVQNGAPALPTELMVSYAYDSIARRNPVSFFGMVFVLETTSATLATAAARDLAQTLGLPPAAFTYLCSHGHVDQAHIADLAGIVNQFSEAGDLDAVIHMAQVMYELYRGVFTALPRARSATSGRQATREVA